MGITGLLPLLKDSMERVHISKFKGRTVAIDAYCWLHKGAYACAKQLTIGEPTTLYLDYCLSLLTMLLSLQIKPILVFDGQNLPEKAAVDAKRRQQRKQAKHRAAELLRLGKPEEAAKYFNACIEIKPFMISALIKQGRKLGVDSIVAPFEADAQLAFFSRNGIADLVITEDSDLIVYGCKKILYKMGKDGCGDLLDLDKLHLSFGVNKEAFNFNKFRWICIIAGCDYLESIYGVALKRAINIVEQCSIEDPAEFIKHLPLPMKTEAYEEGFLSANYIFQHQTIFDPYSLNLMPLNPIGNIDNAKVVFNCDIRNALELALGNIDSKTRQRTGTFDPRKTTLHFSSIWYKSTHALETKPYSILGSSTPSFKLNKPSTITKRAYTTSSQNTPQCSTSQSYDDSEIDKQVEFYRTQKVEEPEVKKLILKTKNVPSTSKNPFSTKPSKFSCTKSGEDRKLSSRYFDFTNKKTDSASGLKVAGPRGVLSERRLPPPPDFLLSQIFSDCQEEAAVDPAPENSGNQGVQPSSSKNVDEEKENDGVCLVEVEPSLEDLEGILLPVTEPEISLKRKKKLKQMNIKTMFKDMSKE